VLIDRDPDRLALATTVHRELGSSAELLTLLHAERAENDRIVSTSPPGSLIINATGMGKDLPGSPISETVAFPPDSVAWDLNYRGELGFLRTARRQPPARHVRVADGWRYFLHGWTEVIAEVFDLQLAPERFAELAAAAGGSGSFVTAQAGSQLGAIS
jgi:shikimate dehydrogenase